MKHLAREFFWFGISGALGFAIDSTVLYCLKDLLGLFLARFFSFLSAVFFTWLFNRTITFNSRRSNVKKGREFVLYVFLMCGGGVINLGVYGLLIFLFTRIEEFPIIGVACGSLAGMFVNLFVSRNFLYKNAESK